MASRSGNRGGAPSFNAAMVVPPTDGKGPAELAGLILQKIGWLNPLGYKL
jgi:hypothetical protein